MELSKQEQWSGLPFTTPGDLPDPGIQPSSPASPALAGGFFTTDAQTTQEAPRMWCVYTMECCSVSKWDRNSAICNNMDEHGGCYALSEMSQTETEKYCMVPLICRI